MRGMVLYNNVKNSKINEQKTLLSEQNKAKQVQNSQSNKLKNNQSTPSSSRLWNDQNSEAGQDFDMIQRILKRGVMVRVLRGTFVKDQFVVDHLYKGIRAELVRKKQQIISHNINILLDYYEKILELRQRPLMPKQPISQQE